MTYTPPSPAELPIVDVMVGKAQIRVTLISEQTLRIEPDEICVILAHDKPGARPGPGRSFSTPEPIQRLTDDARQHSHNMPARVTLLTDKTLRIEPDDVGTIIAATTEEGRTTLCVTSRRAQVGGGR
jgi:hypothetical protein